MKDTPVTSIRNIEFCIHTEDNTAGLEALLYSIAEFYPDARVLIADSDKNLDRAYYKKLRTELAEAGLGNRPVIHHVGYKVGTSRARNFLMSQSRLSKLLFLDDTMLVTKDTDIRKLLEVLDSNRTIGVACGLVDEAQPPVADGKPMSAAGIKFVETKGGTEFLMMKNDIANFIRYNANATHTHTDFFNRMDKVPFVTVFVPDVTISKQNEVSDETPNSDNSGEAAQSVIPPASDGNQEGGNSAPVGQDEEGKSSSPSKSTSGGRTRPIRG